LRDARYSEEIAQLDDWIAALGYQQTRERSDNETTGGTVKPGDGTMRRRRLKEVRFATVKILQKANLRTALVAPAFVDGRLAHHLSVETIDAALKDFQH
jgi:hypothetical protein